MAGEFAEAGACHCQPMFDETNGREWISDGWRRCVANESPEWGSTEVPSLVLAAGDAARFAFEEFFHGQTFAE